MKKIYTYTILALSMLTLLFACEPIEPRESMGGEIEASQLNVTATPVIVDGKKSNKIALDNHSPVLSLWDYGIGTSVKTTDTILMVSTGNHNITFTGINPNGTRIEKVLPVEVEELSFPVPPEWAYLVGEGTKTWVWDETAPAVWGNGQYLDSNAPAWWTLKIGDIDGQAKGEGEGASMEFTLQGAKLTKYKSDGSATTGAFSLDMNTIVKKADGTIWAKGKLITRGVGVLCGISPNEGGKEVSEYDILILDNKKMILSYPEPGAEQGGTGWFWVFRAK